MGSANTLTPGDLGQDGADALAQPQSLGPTIAQNIIKAGQVNNGSPRDWAENAVAGVNAALAGFGAAGKVPEGAGALYGVGAAMRQQQANKQEQAKVRTEEDQRQQQIDLEQQRVKNEKGNMDFDQQMRLAENARQQANQVKQFALDDANLKRITDENTDENFKRMAAHADFMLKQIDASERFWDRGGQLFKPAGGEPSPTFNDVGEAEKWATTHKLADEMHVHGYRPTLVMNPDGTMVIGEVPESGIQEREFTDSNGKKFTTPADTTTWALWDEKMSEISLQKAEAAKDYAEAKHYRDEYAGSDTAARARAHFDKTADKEHPFGNYDALEPGERQALLGDALNQYKLDNNAYERAQLDMKKAIDSGAIPSDKDGNPDVNSQEYKKYQDDVDQSKAMLGASRERVSQIDPLVRSYMKKIPAGNEGLPKAPNPGAPIPDGVLKQYLDANDGDVGKAKAAAKAAGWGDPGGGTAGGGNLPMHAPLGNPALPGQIPRDAQYTGPGATAAGNFQRNP